MKLLTSLVSICVFLWLSSISFAQGELVYERSDPAFGFTIVSYHDDRPDEWRDYRQAINELKKVGANHVNLVVFRRVNAKGTLDPDSGPEFQTISYAAKLADRLGLDVTLTPIFETSTGWRGEWDPTGATLDTFCASYSRFILNLAKIAKSRKAEKIYVGSELKAFVNRPANQNYLKKLVSQARKSPIALIRILSCSPSWYNGDGGALSTNWKRMRRQLRRAVECQSSSASSARFPIIVLQQLRGHTNLTTRRIKLSRKRSSWA